MPVKQTHLKSSKKPPSYGLRSLDHHDSDADDSVTDTPFQVKRSSPDHNHFGDLADDDADHS